MRIIVAADTRDHADCDCIGAIQKLTAFCERNLLHR